MKPLIDKFVEKVINYGVYSSMDYSYVKNRVLALVGEEGIDTFTKEEDIKNLKDSLVEIAEKNGKVQSTAEEKDCLGAELMNFITPIPSLMNEIFWNSYKVSPQKAIENFYQISKDNDYIKLSAISKNQGRVNYPARANHRIIRMNLGEELWGFQYSPYSYFNEHAIFFNSEHVPMAITPKTFEQLLDIIDIIPGYFVGSNSDLPISGGSILSHNHYQGGKYVFPMEKADCDITFEFIGFEDIEAGIVNWPMSVIRLRGKDKKRIIELSSKILEKWKNYTDIELDIIAKTGDTPHHTVTPIARKVDGKYEMDIVLRDNHTSELHPDGVYHPHKDVHHIKKENIGLIEVMGLAILPPRLKTELEEVEKFLLNKPNEVAKYHLDWAKQLKEKYLNIEENKVTIIIQYEVGQIFARVLEDAGVYKNNQSGREGFKRFIETVGIN